MSKDRLGYILDRSDDIFIEISKLDMLISRLIGDEGDNRTEAEDEWFRWITRASSKASVLRELSKELKMFVEKAGEKYVRK
jgi:hypothetical protein